MKKIAFHVEKGGTGKTTMSGNIAFALSQAGYKVCMLDGDPQGNLTSWFWTDTLDFEFVDRFIHKEPIENIIKNVRENLFLCPTISIDGNLKSWSEKSLFELPYAFNDLFDELEAMGFDFLIADLGPGISNLEKRILACMDEIIPVVSAEYFAVDGLEIFENELKKIRENHRAKFTAEKLVINRVNETFKIHKDYLAELKKRGYQTYFIGQDIKISNSIPYHESYYEFDNKARFWYEIVRLGEDLRAIKEAV